MMNSFIIIVAGQGMRGAEFSSTLVRYGTIRRSLVSVIDTTTVIANAITRAKNFVASVFTPQLSFATVTA